MFEDIEYAALTDVGRERSENQDNYGDARLERFEFFYVCDGMGGHAGGSTASRLGVDTMRDVLESDDSEPRVRMEKAIDAANNAIFQKQVEQRELRGMGTTVVAIAVDKENEIVHFAHVGDSRGYLLRRQVFKRLTRDHTMVQRLVDDGVITAEEAEHHPNSNVISRSLGGYPEVEVEHGDEPLEIQAGDTFLLCSDGLSGLVSEPEMASILAKQDPPEAIETLVRRANEEGGHDNITVEIIRLGTYGSTNPAEPIRIEHPPKGPSSRELLAKEREAAERVMGDENAGEGKTANTVSLDMSGNAETTPDQSATKTASDAAPAPNRLTPEELEHRRVREKLILAIFILLIVFLALLIALLIRVGMSSDEAATGAASALVFARWLAPNLSIEESNRESSDQDSL
jgi:serine/threonine protein phosphatase PrpC